jgi:protocatechuate 3,4-dioxygenase beta subunit
VPAMTTESNDRALSRGALVKAAGGAGLAVAFGVRALDALGADAETTATCVLQPEVTEGPYWIDQKLTRRDVREGKPGLPLVLAVTVMNARTCKPIKGADVEIWHCDASGNYSGFDSGSGGNGPGGPGGGGPATSTRYLRGHQPSNAAGVATFLTVFPGWYPGRTPHIHLKAHIGQDRVVHTGQLFFNEVVTAAVYKQAPYSSHGQYDTPHARDMIYAQAGGARAVVRLTKRTHGLRGYVGRIVVGVAA